MDILEYSHVTHEPNNSAVFSTAQLRAIANVDPNESRDDSLLQDCYDAAVAFVQSFDQSIDQGKTVNWYCRFANGLRLSDVPSGDVMVSYRTVDGQEVRLTGFSLDASAELPTLVYTSQTAFPALSEAFENPVKVTFTSTEDDDTRAVNMALRFAVRGKFARAKGLPNADALMEAAEDELPVSPGI